MNFVATIIIFTVQLVTVACNGRCAILRAICVKGDVIVISRSTPQLLFCPNRSDSAVIPRIDIMSKRRHRIVSATLTIADLEHRKPLRWGKPLLCLSDFFVLVKTTIALSLSLWSIAIHRVSCCIYFSLYNWSPRAVAKEYLNQRS